jgi:hypothetical protein
VGLGREYMSKSMPAVSGTDRRGDLTSQVREGKAEP